MPDDKPLWERCGVTGHTRCEVCTLPVGEGVRSSLIFSGKAWCQNCLTIPKVRDETDGLGGDRTVSLYAIINRSWIGRRARLPHEEEWQLCRRGNGARGRPQLHRGFPPSLRSVAHEDGDPQGGLLQESGQTLKLPYI